MRPAAMGRLAVRRMRRSVRALERLVERGRAAGDDGDAGEGLDEAGVEGADAAAQAAEIEAGSGGDDDHGGDAELEEGGVVGEQRVWLRGGEDVIGCRGGCHVSVYRVRDTGRLSCQGAAVGVQGLGRSGRGGLRRWVGC